MPVDITLAQIEKVIYERRKIPAEAILNVYVYGSRMYGSHQVAKPQAVLDAIAKTQAAQQQEQATTSSNTNTNYNKAPLLISTMANDYDIYVVVDNEKYPNLLQEIDNTLDDYQLKLPSHIFTALINPIVKVWLSQDGHDNAAAAAAASIAMDITFKTRAEYIDDVYNADPTALACASLQCHKSSAVYSECCFKETMVMDLPLIPNAVQRSYSLLKSIRRCFEVSIHRGTRMLQMRNDHYNGIKNFFHACRNLLFKIQVLKHGHVTDYSAGNAILKQMYEYYEQIIKQDNYLAATSDTMAQANILITALQQRYHVEEREKLFQQIGALLNPNVEQQQQQ